MIMIQSEREEQLEQLRKEWIEKPWMRDVIERRAKALTMFEIDPQEEKLI